MFGRRANFTEEQLDNILKIGADCVALNSVPREQREVKVVREQDSSTERRELNKKVGVYHYYYYVCVS